MTAVERSKIHTNGRPDRRHPFDGARDPRGDGLGVRERDPLGDELADDHRQRRDEDHHHGECDALAVRRDQGVVVQHDAEPRAQRGAAEGAGGECR